MEDAIRRGKKGIFGGFLRKETKCHIGCIFIAPIIFLSLTGCSTVQKPTYKVEVDTPKRPVLQQNLVSECPDLPKLTKDNYTQGELIDTLTEWISLYQRCQYKHHETVKFIQTYLNE